MMGQAFPSQPLYLLIDQPEVHQTLGPWERHTMLYNNVMIDPY